MFKERLDTYFAFATKCSAQNMTGWAKTTFSLKPSSTFSQPLKQYPTMHGLEWAQLA